jgi:hypothetical protein
MGVQLYRSPDSGFVQIIGAVVTYKISSTDG